MRTSSRPNTPRLGALIAGSARRARRSGPGRRVGPPAAAGPPEATTEQYSFEAWDCGYPMQVEGEVTSRFLTRPNPHGEGVLAQENVDFSETWTDADGDHFTPIGAVPREGQESHIARRDALRGDGAAIRSAVRDLR